MGIPKYWAPAILLGYGAMASAALPAGQAKPDHDPENIWQAEKGDCKALPAATSAKLGLIRQMLAGGKPHAAIAYLDAAKIQAPQADLLRADGLRQTGREEEAGRLYRRLLGTCMAGYAYQGMGLSASKAGKPKEAVAHLQAASAALPIDTTIRNDYGYALMATGDHQAALHEFLTAIELAPDNRRAVHNLILLLNRMGEFDKAQVFAQRFNMAPAEMSGLQALAQPPLASTTVEMQPSAEAAALPIQSVVIEGDEQPNEVPEPDKQKEPK